jgi:hypothetical protein
MRFRFWGVDATSGEASPRGLSLGEGPLSLAASDALVSPASAVHGFRATEVLGLIDLTPPAFSGARTRSTTFRTLVLPSSQAEKAVTVPARAGDRLGDLGKAAKGPSIPGKALIEQHHPFQFAPPLAQEQRSRVEANSVPRRWLAVVERTSGEINRSALRSANNAQGRFIEIAKCGA